MGILDNQIAVVTGAGSGIGRAVTEAFLRESASVALVGRRLDRLQEVASGFPEDRVMACRCDVGNRAEVESSLEQVRKRMGKVGILVNNAGINTSVRDLAHVDPFDWDNTLAVNLTGAFNCARVVLPGMREMRNGVIINVSSIAGKRASKLGGVAYVASKHGMVGLTHSINVEEGQNGIRSTVICPGEVDTPILEFRPDPVSQERRDRMLHSEDIAACAVLVAGLPARACVPEIVITPTVQSYS